MRLSIQIDIIVNNNYEIVLFIAASFIINVKSLEKFLREKVNLWDFFRNSQISG